MHLTDSIMNKELQKKFERLTDKQIITLVVNDDEQAIEYLFFTKCSILFNHIIKNIFNYSIPTEEIIGEFYIHLNDNNWAKLKNFKYESKLLTYLTIIAIHFFTKKKINMTKISYYNTLNIENNFQKLQKDLYSEERNSHISKITKYELYDAINKITNPRYKWVVLSELEGKSVEEMAQGLNTTVINIYNLKKRAKGELIILLNE